MPVTLEAPAVAAGDGSVAPLWRVQCDHGGPGDRLLLLAETANIAAARAVVEYGWTLESATGGDRVWCREHRRELETGGDAVGPEASPQAPGT